MIKASAPAPITTMPTSIEELFANHGGNLDWLDLDSPSPVLEQSNWRALSEVCLNREIERLETILGLYLANLETPVIESIDSIVSDGFIDLLQRMRRVDETLRRSNLGPGPQLYGTAHIRDKLFAKLVIVSKQIEGSDGCKVVVPSSLTRIEMKPNAGEARLTHLPPNHIILGAGDPPIGGPQGPWPPGSGPVQ
jgi:hypothetical protein